MDLLYEIKYDIILKDSKRIAGFDIEIEDIIIDNYDTFLEYFTDGIMEDSRSLHLVKFHDEIRLESYIRFYREIAEVEMQLREILSFIFYYEYTEDFYNLLNEYEANVIKDLEQDDLRKRLENQFFYLTFNGYLNLDKPKEIKNIKEINDILESSASYEEFRDKVCNRGIKCESHKAFLASIKPSLQTIEAVRNSIAHSRTVSSTKFEHYQTAKNRLLESFKIFWENTI